MGNSASSCTFYAASSNPIKVIDGDGDVQEYWNLVRAAEIMLENPGYFVCDSNHLAIGCRIPGLAADEELEQHRLYFILPMDMLYSVLTEEEMASLLCKATATATATAKRSGVGRRILPVLGDHLCLFTPEATKQVMKKDPVKSNLQSNVRIVAQRSWKPALDTIEEVP